MGADHLLPPECHDNQKRLEDAEFCRAPWKDWVDCKRRTANGREFQSVMVRGKKWIFEDISTNCQWHKFIFAGGSSRPMPWWNWEVIQRKSRKIIQCLVKNRQTRVFTTFEQEQPTKFVEQTSDRSCMTIIFFWQNGQHDVEHVRVAGYLWPYTDPTLQRHSKLGRTKDKYARFLASWEQQYVVRRTKLRVLVA